MAQDTEENSNPETEAEAPAGSEVPPVRHGDVRTDSAAKPDAGLDQRQKARDWWPFDAGVTIALVALAVSGLQFLFTTPKILSLYYHPEVVVTNITSTSTSDPTLGFRVENLGRETAENVEVGVISHEGDSIRVMPVLGATITPNESVLYRTFSVHVPRLHPGESFVILVHLEDPNHDRERPYTGQLQLSDGETLEVRVVVPSISYARSDAGPGQVNATRFDFVPRE